MRFMVIVKGDQRYEEGQMPSEQELAEMGKFNEELANAGMMQRIRDQMESGQEQ